MLRAISLWQPWADAIRCGAKRFETRSWPCPHRGLLAIHASKHIPRDGYERAAVVAACEAMYRAGVPNDALSGAYGMVIAVAGVAACFPTHQIPTPYSPLSELEYALGNFGPGRWAWLLEDVRRIDPVPCRGMQGIFTLPPEIEAAVMGRL